MANKPHTSTVHAVARYAIFTEINGAKCTQISINGTTVDVSSTYTAVPADIFAAAVAVPGQIIQRFDAGDTHPLHLWSQANLQELLSPIVGGRRLRAPHLPGPAQRFVRTYPASTSSASVLCDICCTRKTLTDGIISTDSYCEVCGSKSNEVGAVFSEPLPTDVVRRYHDTELCDLHALYEGRDPFAQRAYSATVCIICNGEQR
jgi:hypothetical protein